MYSFWESFLIKFTLFFSFFILSYKTVGIRCERRIMKDNRNRFILERNYLIQRQKEMGLTIERAADLLEISPRYFRYILSGFRGSRMSSSLGAKICKVFGFARIQFLELEDQYQSEAERIKKSVKSK